MSVSVPSALKSLVNPLHGRKRRFRTKGGDGMRSSFKVRKQVICLLNNNKTSELETKQLDIDTTLNKCFTVCVLLFVEELQNQKSTQEFPIRKEKSYREEGQILKAEDFSGLTAGQDIRTDALWKTNRADRLCTVKLWMQRIRLSESDMHENISLSLCV